MIGGHNAQNLKEADIYLRILGKVRLSDEETTESQFMISGQGSFSWKLPSNGYGDKTVELENAEAAALTTAIESCSPVRINDAEWLGKVVSHLKPEAEVAKVQ
jgi:hypothetical protein